MADLPAPEYSRILHIHNSTRTPRRYLILDSDNQTPLYTLTTNSTSLFARKPHMQLYRGPPPTPTTPCIASATFGFFTNTNISLSLSSPSPNSPTATTTTTIKMSSNNKTAGTHSFHSPDLGPLKWKRDGGTHSDLALVDDSGEPLARVQELVDKMAVEGEREWLLEIRSRGVEGRALELVVLGAGVMVENYARRSNDFVGDGNGLFWAKTVESSG